MTPFDRVLIFETSGRVGRLALAAAGRIITSRLLSETRRHARDLTVQTKDMLDAHGWSPRTITSVIAGIGPGSYTGLRVGIAAAKAFAYSIDCPIFAMPTFDAIAFGVEPGDFSLYVVADALQGNFYTAGYEWTEANGWIVQTPLAICRAQDWVRTISAPARIVGPGAALVEFLVRNAEVTFDKSAHANVEQVLAAATKRPDAYRSNPYAIEPIYMRGSSAEEKRKQSASGAT